MSRISRQKSKGRSDSNGGFAGIPRIVLKHSHYQNLSGGAVKLLVELASQFRGKNNGDFTVAYGVLKKKGVQLKRHY
ncbi:hypothetical protein TDB9533_00405 [Thalassocella blandensis]|nr:hypothetical protein TDB9533_00405 [Thalassocella blandensis]